MVDDVGHHLARVEGRRVDRQRVRPRAGQAHAERRGVDDEVGGGHVAGTCDPARRPGQRRSPGRRLRRPVDHGDLRRPGGPQRPGHRPPAPPAPTTTQRSPAGSTPASRRRLSTNPSPSVLSPTSRSPSRNTQFTAPSAAATGVVASTAPWAAGLVGHGDRQPPDAQRAGGLDRGGPWPSGTSRATKAQSAPVAAKAALRMVGDSEWRIGEPMTAASRVSPVITGRPRPHSAPEALGRALGLQPQELVVVVGEGVVPVGVGQDVPPPGTVRRVASAASMLARPGEAMGVGGRPARVRVL